MVKFCISFLLLLFSFQGIASTDVEIRLELSKPQFFEGEPIVASYVIEAPQEKVVEIEVVKFPEFRGFWSENTLLRQGPVHLSALLKKNGKASAVIGAYNLNSMMGYSTPSIEPIRVLIREQNQSSQISPDRKDFSPVSLPPIPVQLKKYPFSGGVGVFSAQIERSEIPYRPGQPFLLRAQLIGEGNFAEINKIPLVLPPELSLVSQTSFNDSHAGRLRKIFEWVLSTESNQLSPRELGGFLYFDPSLKKYQPLTFPALTFKLIPEVKLPETKLNTDSIQIIPDRYESTYTPLLKLPAFWWIQFLFLAALFGDLIFFLIRKRQNHLANDVSHQRLLRARKASKALKLNDWSVFLPLAAEIARSVLDEEKRLGIKSSQTHKFGTLIEADNHFRYSPHKMLMVPTEEIVSTWNDLTKRLNRPPSL